MGIAPTCQLFTWILIFMPWSICYIVSEASCQPLAWTEVEDYYASLTLDLIPICPRYVISIVLYHENEGTLRYNSAKQSQCGF